MNCRECQASFDSLLDGQCERTIQEAAQAHLRGCSDCAVAFAEARKLWELLGQARTCRPSVGFAGRVLRQLDAAPEPVGRSWFGWMPSFRWAVGTAACAVVITIASVTVVEHRRAEQAEQAKQEQLAHFEDLFNIAQKVDPDTVLNVPSFEDEETL